jgi:hypothetical protein
VPTEDRIGCDDRPEFSQDLPPKSFTLCREAAPLVSGEPEAPVTIQFLEHSYLLLQELDLVSLFLVEPSGDGEQHHFDGRCQHRASLRGFQIRLRWMRPA